MPVAWTLLINAGIFLTLPLVHFLLLYGILFLLRSDGKDFVLDAGTRTNMMFWLQSLQNKRREYSLKRVKLSTDRIGQWSSVVRFYS